MREKILVGVLSAIFFLATVGIGSVFASDAEVWLKKAQAAARAGNYQKAASLFKKACDGGDALGCSNLGVMYETGLGVNQSYTKAASLYKKACNAGDALGCYGLGVMYKKGIGIKKDYTKAIALYKKACKGGYSVACQTLEDLQSRCPIHIYDRLSQNNWLTPCLSQSRSRYP